MPRIFVRCCLPVSSIINFVVLAGSKQNFSVLLTINRVC